MVNGQVQSKGPFRLREKRKKAKRISDEPSFPINDKTNVCIFLFDAHTVDGTVGEYISRLNMR